MVRKDMVVGNSGFCVVAKVKIFCLSKICSSFDFAIWQSQRVGVF